MRERLLTCAAVGLFSGAAYGQSSVTLYGVVDTNLEYINRVGSVPLPTNLITLGRGIASPA